MPNNCPRCEYTIRWNRFKAECEKEFAKKSPGPQADADWPLTLILRYLNDISSLDASVRGKGFRPNWTVVTVMLVMIYRDELGKYRAEEDWNRKEEWEAEKEKYEARRRGERDD